MRRISRPDLVSGLASFLIAAALASDRASAQCPPLPPGDDVLASTAKLVLTLDNSTGSPEVVRLSSEGLPATVLHRDAQVGNSIPVELIQMELTGRSVQLGPLRLRLSTASPSVGAIDGVIQSPVSCALVRGDLSLDVLVELDVLALGETWLASGALPVFRRIHELPPKDEPLESPEVSEVTFTDAASGDSRGRAPYFRLHADPAFPPGGPDLWESKMTVGIQLYDSGYSAVLSSGGSTRVRRADPVLGPFGLPHVDTEMVVLALRGSDPLLGNFNFSLVPNVAALGRIESAQPVPTYPASSFFDVRLDLNSDALGPLTTLAPTHIEANPAAGDPIRDTPALPETAHKSSPGAVTFLYDSNLAAPVGELVNFEHRVGLYRSALPMPPGGEDCFETTWRVRLLFDSPFTPADCTETLDLTGGVRVLRGNPVDPGDGRDRIDALIAKVGGTALSGCVGTVSLLASDLDASTGTIRSLAPAENFPAESAFATFFRLDTFGLGLLRSGAGQPIDTTVNAIPPEPGEIHYGPGLSSPLVDVNNQIVGRIEVLQAIAGESAACGPDNHPTLSFPHGKELVTASSGKQGAGLVYDLVRGDLGPATTTKWLVSLGSGTCLVNDGPDSYVDPDTPLPKNLFWYLWRDGYSTGATTFNDIGAAVNRDEIVLACP